MPMLRDYRLFTVTYTYETREAHRDVYGDLKGYGPVRREKETMKIVARGEMSAKAFVLEPYGGDREIVSISEEPIDGIVINWSH